ncbi:MAG: NAD(+)/NADH kinase [Desulfovibrionaceae bacterium]|nr:NAD(+)/NADH kinase [Desulfovibrionaceae bacterium]
MAEKVRRVLIVTKADDPGAEALGSEMSSFLLNLGLEAYLCEHRTDVPSSGRGYGERFDLILVLGGDGTLLSVARKLHYLGAPLLGIDLGRVGFLAEMSSADWRPVLEDVVAGGFRVARRMVLDFLVRRSGAVVHSGLVVNDLVISRSTLARLIRLGLYYGDSFVSSFRADGLIVSTPTGSTAYTVSAGGPLIYPGLEVFCVTPVCPFLCSLKPMVLPSDRPIRVVVEEIRGEVSLSEDGQSMYGLMPGDLVVAERNPRPLLLAEAREVDFFDKLKDKGFLREK